MAKIVVDSHLDDIKTFEELKRRVTRIFEKIQNDLNALPSFLVINSDEQEVPKETPINTIVFKIKADTTVKQGYYTGEEIIFTP